MTNEECQKRGYDHVGPCLTCKSPASHKTGICKNCRTHNCDCCGTKFTWLHEARTLCSGCDKRAKQMKNPLYVFRPKKSIKPQPVVTNSEAR